MLLGRDAIVAWTVSVVGLFSIAGCSRVSISNAQVNNHAFLRCMHDDDYPKHLVDKGRQILVRLAARIEDEKPADVAALYVLTQASRTLTSKS